MINTYIALDLETTGTNPASDRIIEIGAARIVDGNVEDTRSILINPGFEIPERITEITGICDLDVVNAPRIQDVLDDILDFTKDMPILGHNVIFDYSFLKKAAIDGKRTFDRDGIDTLKIARRLLPGLPKKNLPNLCAYFKINPGKSHRALDDALSASRLYEKLYELNPLDEGFEKALPLMYSVKKDSPITPAQRSYLSSLARQHNIELSMPIDEFSKSQASRMIDKILSKYGKII